jgi:antitoxin component of MazEF toxin-antitoxin module
VIIKVGGKMKKSRKSTITTRNKPKPTLRQLLAKVTKENLHHEVDTGTAIGNEIW